MSEYFPKPKSLGANVKAGLDLSNYWAKADLNLDFSSDFPTKTDLGDLKSDLDKLNIDKLKNVPSGLSNL